MKPESEYTPTVERLRDDYRRSRVWEAHNWEEFERRLKEIQADAWDEALELLRNYSAINHYDLEHYQGLNPYRKEQHDE